MAFLGTIVILAVCSGLSMWLGYTFGYEDGQDDLEIQSHHYDLNS